MEIVWSRTSGEGYEDEDIVPLGGSWREMFLNYKLARVRVRWELWSAIDNEDFELAAKLKKEWEGGGKMPEEASMEQQVCARGFLYSCI
jgi:hypothetical protein